MNRWPAIPINRCILVVHLKNSHLTYKNSPNNSRPKKSYPHTYSQNLQSAEKEIIGGQDQVCRMNLIRSLFNQIPILWGHLILCSIVCLKISNIKQMSVLHFINLANLSTTSKFKTMTKYNNFWKWVVIIKPIMTHQKLINNKKELIGLKIIV